MYNSVCNRDVHYSCTDASSNVAEAQRKVRIVDTVHPNLLLFGSLTQHLTCVDECESGDRTGTLCGHNKKLLKRFAARAPSMGVHGDLSDVPVDLSRVDNEYQTLSAQYGE